MKLLLSTRVGRDAINANTTSATAIPRLLKRHTLGTRSAPSNGTEALLVVRIDVKLYNAGKAAQAFRKYQRKVRCAYIPDTLATKGIQR